MKILEGILSAVVATFLATVLGAVLRLNSRQKVKQNTGGWTPIDLSDLEFSTEKN